MKEFGNKENRHQYWFILSKPDFPSFFRWISVMGTVNASTAFCKEYLFALFFLEWTFKNANILLECVVCKWVSRKMYNHEWFLSEAEFGADFVRAFNDGF